MSLRILTIGRKHESWVAEGIDRYEKRMKKPFDVTWQPIPHSSREHDAARREESETLLAKLAGKHANDFVILLDERGKNIDSPTLARTLQQPLDSSRNITLIIGGAYGVDDSIHRPRRLCLVPVQTGLSAPTGPADRHGAALPCPGDRRRTALPP